MLFVCHIHTKSSFKLKSKSQINSFQFLLLLVSFCVSDLTTAWVRASRQAFDMFQHPSCRTGIDWERSHFGNSLLTAYCEGTVKPADNALGKHASRVAAYCGTCTGRTQTCIALTCASRGSGTGGSWLWRRLIFQ